VLIDSRILIGGDAVVTERQNEILNLIIDIFTKTHEPVGSKALQDSINSSSATIRNDMAALEKQGLLEKAHTSSGRKPSVAGFQYFVKHSLSFDRLAENELYEVIKAFDHEFFNLEDILQQAADLLTKLSGCTVVALDVEPSRQRLTAFDIVVLSQHTALAVFTLDESNTITSQFMIPRNFLKEDLDRLKGLVRERFLGQTVLDIHYKIRTEIPQIIQRYFTTTDNVIQLFEHIFGDIFKENVILSGKVQLLEFSDLSAYQFFDAAVNHGLGNASRMLQRAVNVADDGIIGNMTIAAIKKMAISDVIMRLNAERLEFYCKLSTFATFGKGWIRRVAGNLKYGAIDNEV